jgi:hypothetical protein
VLPLLQANFTFLVLQPLTILEHIPNLMVLFILVELATNYLIGAITLLRAPCAKFMIVMPILSLGPNYAIVLEATPALSSC